MSKKNRITRIRGFDSRSPLGNGLLSVGITRGCGFDSPEPIRCENPISTQNRKLDLKSKVNLT